MPAKQKTQKERVADKQLKILGSLFEKRGITVRRERLSRGPGYRVKSGGCHLTGNGYLFIERRMPSDHQLSLLVDYFVDLGFAAEDSELDGFSPKIRKLLSSQSIAINSNVSQ